MVEIEEAVQYPHNFWSGALPTDAVQCLGDDIRRQAFRRLSSFRLLLREHFPASSLTNQATVNVPCSQSRKHIRPLKRLVIPQKSCHVTRKVSQWAHIVSCKKAYCQQRDDTRQSRFPKRFDPWICNETWPCLARWLYWTLKDLSNTLSSNQ